MPEQQLFQLTLDKDEAQFIVLCFMKNTSGADLPVMFLQIALVKQPKDEAELLLDIISQMGLRG